MIYNDLIYRTKMNHRVQSTTNKTLPYCLSDDSVLN